MQEESPTFGVDICRHSKELNVISRGRSRKDFIATQEERRRLAQVSEDIPRN